MATTLTERPLVSVIIPAYNHERFIAETVESVLGQTLSDFELIVVDDGSTDKTAEIVQSYNDERLNYFHQENQDAYNTINRGMSLAKGHFLSILNSDDVYSLDRLEKLVKRQREKNAQCIITDVIPISDDGEAFTDPDFGWNVWHQTNREYFFQCGDIYQAFLKGNFMVTTSNLFLTAEAAEKVGEFTSLRYLHDYDYIFRIMLAYPGQVEYMAEDKLLKYRIHSGNTLGEAAILGREQDLGVISNYMERIIPQEYKKYVQAGSERLIELGNELHDVRCSLEGQTPIGVRPAFKICSQSLKVWVKKKIGIQ